MKNKKIKVFVDVFYFRAAGAGIRTYISELCRGLKKHGHRNIQYVFSHDIEKKNSNSIYLNSHNRFIRWIFQLHYLIWKQIILPLKINYSSIDYIIFPDFLMPIWVLKAQKICVIHDTFFWDHPKNYSFLWRIFFTKMITAGIDKKTTIVTTSNFSKKNIKRVLNVNNEVKVIYQSSSIIESKIKKIDTIDNNDKFILHVGSFEKRKDLITLVKAFKKLKDNTIHKHLKLVLVGNDRFYGNKVIKKRIIRYIKLNNITNDVIIPGYLKREEISFLYSKALMYVFPSIEEGFGIPILECFHFECPLICSDAETLKEIANDSALYFKKMNSDDLFLKMNRLILNKDERNSLVEKGKERLKLFSQKSFIKKYEREILI